ncbi:MAG: 50S ribosomal protein L4 [Candidatus Marsarchaeota archaeon]|jgi:large subunit ribosomal protein L4e|nr:50S ribosomal protein L4 [Candidatus Marsarchaeota archaeon]
MVTTNVDVFDIKGSLKESIVLPESFKEHVRNDLIRRAVLAEETLTKQPQGHSLLAGMNTTARYYGAMDSYRSGRHRGIAIRPRQKLGGGRQGDVRRIPSAMKGRRAHPHRIEKTIVERINAKEYQKAIRSSIAATADLKYVKQRNIYDGKLPLIISNDIESLKKTANVLEFLKKFGIEKDLDKSKKPQLKKGLRRSSKLRHFRRSVLIIVNDDKGIIKAARNIAGVDVCKVASIKASLLAPGGVPGRLTIWSKDAINNLDEKIKKISFLKGE